MQSEMFQGENSAPFVMPQQEFVCRVKMRKNLGTSYCERVQEYLKFLAAIVNVEYKREDLHNAAITNLYNLQKILI